MKKDKMKKDMLTHQRFEHTQQHKQIVGVPHQIIHQHFFQVHNQDQNRHNIYS